MIISDQNTTIRSIDKYWKFLIEYDSNVSSIYEIQIFKKNHGEYIHMFSFGNSKNGYIFNLEDFYYKNLTFHYDEVNKISTARIDNLSDIYPTTSDRDFSNDILIVNGKRTPIFQDMIEASEGEVYLKFSSVEDLQTAFLCINRKSQYDGSIMPIACSEDENNVSYINKFLFCVDLSSICYSDGIYAILCNGTDALDREVSVAYEFELSQDNLCAFIKKTPEEIDNSILARIPDVYTRDDGNAVLPFKFIESFVSEEELYVEDMHYAWDTYNTNIEHLWRIASSFGTSLIGGDRSLWRKQMINIMDRWKSRGTLLGLKGRMNDCGIELNNFSKNLQVSSDKFHTDMFIVTPSTPRIQIENSIAIKLLMSKSPYYMAGIKSSSPAFGYFSVRHEQDETYVHNDALVNGETCFEIQYEDGNYYAIIKMPSDSKYIFKDFDEIRITYTVKPWGFVQYDKSFHMGNIDPMHRCSGLCYTSNGYIFGATSGVFSNSILKRDINGLSVVSGIEIAPSKRTGCSTWTYEYDEGKAHIIVFGGISESGEVLGDTWSFNTNTHFWKKHECINAVGNAPHKRCSAVAMLCLDDSGSTCRYVAFGAAHMPVSFDINTSKVKCPSVLSDVWKMEITKDTDGNIDIEWVKSELELPTSILPVYSASSGVCFDSISTAVSGTTTTVVSTDENAMTIIYGGISPSGISSSIVLFTKDGFKTLYAPDILVDNKQTILSGGQFANIVGIQKRIITETDISGEEIVLAISENISNHVDGDVLSYKYIFIRKNIDGQYFLRIDDCSHCSISTGGHYVVLSRQISIDKMYALEYKKQQGGKNIELTGEVYLFDLAEWSHESKDYSIGYMKQDICVFNVVKKYYPTLLSSQVISPSLYGDMFDVFLSEDAYLNISSSEMQRDIVEFNDFDIQKTYTDSNGISYWEITDKTSVINEYSAVYCSEYDILHDKYICKIHAKTNGEFLKDNINTLCFGEVHIIGSTQDDVDQNTAWSIQKITGGVQLNFVSEIFTAEFISDGTNCFVIEPKIGSKSPYMVEVICKYKNTGMRRVPPVGTYSKLFDSCYKLTSQPYEGAIACEIQTTSVKNPVVKIALGNFCLCYDSVRQCSRYFLATNYNFDASTYTKIQFSAFFPCIKKQAVPYFKDFDVTCSVKSNRTCMYKAYDTYGKYDLYTYGNTKYVKNEDNSIVFNNLQHEINKILCFKSNGEMFELPTSYVSVSKLVQFQTCSSGGILDFPIYSCTYVDNIPNDVLFVNISYKANSSMLYNKSFIEQKSLYNYVDIEYNDNFSNITISPNKILDFADDICYMKVALTSCVYDINFKDDDQVHIKPIYFYNNYNVKEDPSWEINHMPIFQGQSLATPPVIEDGQISYMSIAVGYKTSYFREKYIDISYPINSLDYNWVKNGLLAAIGSIDGQKIYSDISLGASDWKDIYIMSLHLMDQRNVSKLLTYSSWRSFIANGNISPIEIAPAIDCNTRLMKENDEFAKYICPHIGGTDEKIKFGYIRSAVPFGMTVFNKDEYDGGLHPSYNPCDISFSFVEKCNCSPSSDVSINVDMNSELGVNQRDVDMVLSEMLPANVLVGRMDINHVFNDILIAAKDEAPTHLENQIEWYEDTSVMGNIDNINTSHEDSVYILQDVNNEYQEKLTSLMSPYHSAMLVGLNSGYADNVLSLDTNSYRLCIKPNYITSAYGDNSILFGGKVSEGKCDINSIENVQIVNVGINTNETQYGLLILKLAIKIKDTSSPILSNHYLHYRIIQDNVVHYGKCQIVDVEQKFEYYICGIHVNDMEKTYLSQSIVNSNAVFAISSESIMTDITMISNNGSRLQRLPVSTINSISGKTSTSSTSVFLICDNHIVNQSVVIDENLYKQYEAFSDFVSIDASGSVLSMEEGVQFDIIGSIFVAPYGNVLNFISIGGNIFVRAMGNTVSVSSLQIKFDTDSKKTCVSCAISINSTPITSECSISLKNVIFVKSYNDIHFDNTTMLTPRSVVAKYDIDDKYYHYFRQTYHKLCKRFYISPSFNSSISMNNIKCGDIVIFDCASSPIFKCSYINSGYIVIDSIFNDESFISDNATFPSYFSPDGKDKNFIMIRPVACIQGDIRFNMINDIGCKMLNEQKSYYSTYFGSVDNLDTITFTSSDIIAASSLVFYCVDNRLYYTVGSLDYTEENNEYIYKGNVCIVDGEQSNTDNKIIVYSTKDKIG